MYVALLRGINVGGNNIIPMAALAQTFEGLGFANVRTYIASGNVIFDAPKASPRKLEEKIEHALTKAHAYAARIVLRDRAQMLATVEHLPAAWRKPKPDVRYNVLFLRHTIDTPAIFDKLAPKPGIESVTYHPGVLFWSAPVATITRTQMQKLTLLSIYKDVTVRNLNTTKKLAELMAEVSPPSSGRRRAARPERAG
jgi:uncharacterized protein (DUF1697 family)